MKAIRIVMLATACLALVFAVGTVGAFEAGHLTALEALARCSANLGLLWASIKIYNKLQDTERG